MSLFKAIFGSNDDKRKMASNSETPKDKSVEDYSKQMIPLEELYRLEEMHIPESLELPQRENQQKVTTQIVDPTGTAQPHNEVISNVTAQLQSESESAGVPQPKDCTQPNGVVQPDGEVKSNGTTKPIGAVKPNGTVQPNGAITSNGVTQQHKGNVKTYGAPKGAFGKPFVPKPLVVDTKLTIILVENTKEVAKEKDKLKVIVKNLVTTGYICVINYGSLVREGEIVESKNFDCNKLLHKDFVGDNACLFDALTTLEDVVKKTYKKSEEFKNKRVRFQSIDVIGIGRCFDNCSIASSEIASESFSKVAGHTDVTTKYFCLTEESFIAAATIGFHSIGAIARNYM